jgi:hypothetical protein
MPLGIKPDLDLLVGQRTGVIHLHVVFTGIDQLDRLADRLGSRERRDDHVRFQPAPEAAAQEMLMDHDVLGINAGYRSRDQRGAGVELIAGIDVPGAVLLHGQRVHRLERRMDVEAGEVFALDDSGSLPHRGG